VSTASAGRGAATSTAAPAGGPAAIHGFLYQLLGALDRTVRLSIPDGETGEATLVEIEPDGGDLETRTSSGIVVEQWKGGSSRRTWSLRDVIEEVLPDLYLAARRHGDQASYVLVAAGRRGQWDLAEAFFRELGHSATDVLDDPAVVKFAPGYCMTRRALFDQVVERLRSHPDIASDTEQDTRTTLRALLSSLSFRWGQDLEDLAVQTDRLLCGWVTAAEDASAKRRELIGLLMERGRAGAGPFTPRELLAGASLTGVPLHGVDTVRASVARLTQSFLERVQYDSALDVRPPPQLDEGARCVVVAGESGRGKSWMLARIALDSSTGGRAVTVPVVARPNADGVAQVEEALWRRLLERDHVARLCGFIRRLRHVNAQTPFQRLDVLVDGLTDPEVVGGLLDAIHDDVDVRLIVTLPTTSMASVRRRCVLALQEVRCEDFMTRELNDYLDRRAIGWTNVPLDIRRVIHRPILAKVFADVRASGAITSLHSEYELFEQYWARAREDAASRGQLHIMTWLGEHAACVADGSSTIYPWPALTVANGLALALPFLERAGWLRGLPDGGAECAHDRLLDWAAAEGLVARLDAGVISEADLSEIVRRIDTARSAPRAFAYLPMDVIWLLLRRGWRRAAAGVISALERWHAEPLYLQAIPALGAEVIPALDMRLRDAVQALGSGQSHHVRLVGRALCEIGRVHSETVVSAAVRWLGDPSIDVREASALVLAEVPDPSAIECLWTEYLMQREATDRREVHAYVRKRRFGDALRACLAADRPAFEAWAVRHATTHPAAVALVLAHVRSPHAPAVWRDIKADLMTEAANVVPLLSCIGRFRDSSCLDAVRRYVESPSDEVAMRALATLATLDLPSALDMLPSIARRPSCYVYRPTVRLMLLLGGAVAVRCVEDALVDNPYNAFALGPGLELGSSGSLEVLAARAVEEYDRWEAGPAEERPAAQALLTRILQALERISRLDLLNVLRNLGGSKFERVLVAIVERATPPPDARTIQPDRMIAAGILCKIGSPNLTSVGKRLALSRTPDDMRLGAGLLVRGTASSDAEYGSLARSTIDGDQAFDLRQGLVAVAAAHHGCWRTALDLVLSHPSAWHEDVAHALFSRRVQVGEPERSRLAQAIESDDTLRANAILLISSLRVAELVPALQRRLTALMPDADEGWLVMSGLMVVGMERSDSVELLRARSGAGDLRAVEALTISRSEAATEAAVDLLLNRPPDRPHLADGERAAARRLFFRKVRREELALALWRNIDPDALTFADAPDDLECIGLLADPAVHELLVRCAFDRPPGLPLRNFRIPAIRGLAHHHPDQALRAAEALLASPDDEATGAPTVVFELDAENTISTLTRAMVSEPRPMVRWAIGRTLRRDGARARPIIESLLASDRHGERRAGCSSAGWLAEAGLDERLRDLATTDLEWSVRSAAQAALRRSARLRWAAEIHMSWHDHDATMQWALLDALIELVDPWILEDPDDPLALARVLGDDQPLMWRYVERQLEQRKKDLESEARRDGSEHVT
jgi:hypothetical protein